MTGDIRETIERFLEENGVELTDHIKTPDDPYYYKTYKEDE